MVILVFGQSASLHTQQRKESNNDISTRFNIRNCYIFIIMHYIQHEDIIRYSECINKCGGRNVCGTWHYIGNYHLWLRLFLKINFDVFQVHLLELAEHIVRISIVMSGHLTMGQ